VETRKKKGEKMTQAVIEVKDLIKRYDTLVAVAVLGMIFFVAGVLVSTWKEDGE
jgi:hypothetical protein